MKRLLFLLLLMPAVFANAQDEGSCGTNTIMFVSGNVSFPHGYISPTVKLGVWRTLGRIAPVVSISYQFDDTHKSLSGKSVEGMVPAEIITPFNRLSLEVGAKVRLTERVFLHGYIGISDPSIYLGADLLLKLDEFALMGIGVRNNSPSATVYIRLNR